MSVKYALFIVKMAKIAVFIEQLYPSIFKGEKNIVIEINYVKKSSLVASTTPEHVFAVNLEISKTYKMLSVRYVSGKAMR